MCFTGYQSEGTCDLYQMLENKNQFEENKKGLTVEYLKTSKGFEHISDEEAEQIVFSIKELCTILYHYCVNQNKQNQNEE